MEQPKRRGREIMDKERKPTKIVLHYNDKTTLVIKEGLVLYTTNNDQDALGEFLNIDSKDKVKALSNALGHALNMAMMNFATMEAKEKEGKANRQERDIPSD
jgi:hypothetical protein